MTNETPRIYYLYRITNTQNQKIYIGQSVSPSARWRDHRNAAAASKPNMVISQAIKKYGNENFLFETIACCNNQGDANELETQLVQQYESHISTGKGYNVSNGGMNAPKTEEWKRYMRDLWSQPEYKSHMSIAISDAHQSRSPEEKEKTSQLLSEILSGRHLSPNSEFKEGHQLSDDALQKMSESKIGSIPWNKNTTGVMKANQTSFQPGHKTWNAGTHITTPSSFKSGSKHRMAKLNEEQVLEIFNLYKQGMKKQEIADKFNVKIDTIQNITRGRRWNHITGLLKAK